MIGVGIDQAAVSPEADHIETVSLKVGNFDVDPAEVTRLQHRFRIIEMFENMTENEHVEVLAEAVTEIGHREFDVGEALPGDCDFCGVIVDADAAFGADAGDHFAGSATELENGIGRLDPVKQKIVPRRPIEGEFNRVFMREAPCDPCRIEHDVELPGATHRQPTVQSISNGQPDVPCLGAGQFHPLSKPFLSQVVKVAA